jgi:hypothetical protein
MPIKKRSALPDPNAIVEVSTKLVIEAKPKKPVPPEGRIKALAGSDAPPPTVRAIGSLAALLSDPTDDLLTIGDRVQAMRTPYDPKNSQEIRYRNRVRNRGTAITAFCITCQGGRKAVTECIDTGCPLWAFRFGSDPFYGKRQ